MALRLPRRSGGKHGNAHHRPSQKMTCNKGMAKNLCQVQAPSLDGTHLACMYNLSLYLAFMEYIYIFLSVKKLL